MTPGPGSGAWARERLAPSIDPEAVIVFGETGRVLIDEYVVEKMDGLVPDSFATLHRALAFAEKRYSETGETVRIIGLREIVAAQVGWLS